MKKLIMLFALFFLLLYGCTGREEKNNEMTIVAFNKPIASIVKDIVGNKAEVKVLVEGDPHTFQLTPKNAEALENAILYIGSSRELESFSVNSKNKIYLEDIAKNKIKRNGEINPHYWMDPIIMKELGKRIAEDMKKIDDRNSDYYDKNKESFEKKMNKTINYIYSLFKNKNREYVITHPSMEYFNQEFGLKSYPIFIEGATSSSRLEKIMQSFREGKVKLIAREEQFPEEKIRFITEKLDEEGVGYKIAVIDVLGIEESDYIAMIKKDAEVIAKDI